MIGCDREKRACKSKCREGSDAISVQINKMREYGYSEDEIKKIIAPVEAMLQKTRQEIVLYERLHKKDISALRELSPALLLIGLRIFMGVSRTQLAAALGIACEDVIRDEKNEYSGISLEKYQRIIKALGLYEVPVFVVGGLEQAAALREGLEEQAKNLCENWFVGP